MTVLIKLDRSGAGPVRHSYIYAQEISDVNAMRKKPRYAAPAMSNAPEKPDAVPETTGGPDLSTCWA